MTKTRSKYQKIAKKQLLEAEEFWQTTKLNRVPSGNIEAVGYDQYTNILKVVFKGGSIYRYFDVAQEDYNKVLKGQAKAEDGHSPSYGAALEQYVKKKGYRFERVA